MDAWAGPAIDLDIKNLRLLECEYEDGLAAACSDRVKMAWSGVAVDGSRAKARARSHLDRFLTCSTMRLHRRDDGPHDGGRGTAAR
jgi:hypothetical protein